MAGLPLPSAGSLLGGLLGSALGGGTSSQSTATNTVSLNFNPTVVASNGSGTVAPNNTGGATATPSITQTSAQTPSGGSSFPDLYGTTSAVNPLITPIGSTAQPNSIAGSLSGSTLLLLGGLALLMMMAMTHHKK